LRFALLSRKEADFQEGKKGRGVTTSKEELPHEPEKRKKRGKQPRAPKSRIRDDKQVQTSQSISRARGAAISKQKKERKRDEQILKGEGGKERPNPGFGSIEKVSQTRVSCHRCVKKRTLETSSGKNAGRSRRRKKKNYIELTSK